MFTYANFVNLFNMKIKPGAEQLIFADLALWLQYPKEFQVGVQERQNDPQVPLQ